MGKKNGVEKDTSPSLNDDESDYPDPTANERMRKYGQPRKYEPYFHGPVIDRSLTDVICLILFILAMIVWLCIGLIGFLEGNPSSLVMPTDSKGRTCGVDPEVSDKPNLFFFNILDCLQVEAITNLSCPTPQVCVKDCPDYYYFPLLKTDTDFSLICVDNVNVSDDPEMAERVALISERKCAPYYLESRPVYGRCVPAFLLEVNINDTDFDVETEIINKLTESKLFDDEITVTVVKKAVSLIVNFGSILQVVYDDFINAWYIIVIGLVVGAVLCFIWCSIMRFVAGFMVWGSIIVLHVLLAGGIFFCWNEYMELEGVPGASDDFSFSLNLDSYLRLQKTWLIAGVIMCVLLAIILLLTICLCTRIRIAVALIEEASKAVSAFWSTLIWPIFPFAFQLLVTVLWCAIAVYLATSKQKTFVVNFADGNASNVTFNNFDPCDENNFDPQGTSALCMFNSYDLPEYHTYMQFINLFCFLWVLNFIIGLNQVILAGVFATYFWTVDKKDLPRFPLAKSLYTAVVYHTGSVAFGSLIIAIVQLIRVILEYIEVQLKGKENKVAKFILRCLKCVFWCLEKFLKFINKNAYIMIAIYGKSFCTSAKNAFFLLMRNIIRVAVVNKITDFLLFIGTAMVTTAVVVLSFFYFTFSAEYSFTAFIAAEYLPIPNVRYYWIIIFMIGFGTFVIGHIFFGVFNMAVDTLFLSFLEDLERHDGSPERPYYMNKDLMKIVGKKNRKRHVEEW